MKNLTKIAFINEKGNVARKIANAMKDNYLATIVETLRNAGIDAKLTENKEIVIPVGIDRRTEQIVHARMPLTLTEKDVYSKVTRKKSTKKDNKTETEFEIPTIKFGKDNE